MQIPNVRSGQKSRVLVHLLAFVAIFFWGMSFVSTKVVMDLGRLTPVEAYVYRFTLAYLVILAICHKRIFSRSLRDEIMLALCGMTAGSIYFITENTALTLTSTANVSLLSSTSPLVTILIVGVIYKSETPGRGIIYGSLIAFAGVCCVVLNTVVLSGGELEINPLGDVLALASSFSWAFYSLILKRVNVTYDAMFITRKTFFYGVLTALPFMLLEPELAGIEGLLQTPVILNMLFLALCPSVLSYYLWAVSVNNLGALRANNYMYMQPLVTLVASIIILHEGVTVLAYTGFALILFGLWFGEYLQNRLIKRSSRSGR